MCPVPVLSANKYAWCCQCWCVYQKWRAYWSCQAKENMHAVNGHQRPRNGTVDIPVRQLLMSMHKIRNRSNSYVSRGHQSPGDHWLNLHPDLDWREVPKEGHSLAEEETRALDVTKSVINTWDTVQQFKSKSAKQNCFVSCIYFFNLPRPEGLKPFSGLLSALL